MIHIKKIKAKTFIPTKSKLKDKIIILGKNNKKSPKTSGKFTAIIAEARRTISELLKD